MSTFEFKLPDIGEGVMEGEIVSWLVKPGQNVREDDPMVEVMTDKATVTIGAPKSGQIQDLRATVGEVVAVGAVIVTLALNGSGPAPAPSQSTPQSTTPQSTTPQSTTPQSSNAPARVAAAPPQKAEHNDEPAATAVGDIKETLPGTGFFAQASGGTRKMGSAPAPQSDYFDEKPLATPATRKLARERGIDLRRVRGTGTHGRVTKADVQSFVDGATTPGTISAPIKDVKGPTPVFAPGVEQLVLEERTPFVGMRRKIAQRMQHVTNTAAHFWFVEECDVGRLDEVRQRLKPAAQAAGVRLTFLPFIVKAVIAALKRHPVLNSALDEATNELVTRHYYNIGIAASTDQGLMVPVIKNADRRTILDIANQIERLGNEAKEGRISAADLTGSTFTITSLGKQGGLFATPILNHPEVGILGVHAIKQKPVVRDGAIVIGEVMLLSLAFDHRIVDGHVGAAFAYDIIAYLEDPDRLFLEMA